jgi:hypothetical protein
MLRMVSGREFWCSVAHVDWTSALKSTSVWSPWGSLGRPGWMCVFVAVGTCLPSRPVAVKGGIYFTEPLTSNDRTITHTHRLTGGIYEVRR